MLGRDEVDVVTAARLQLEHHAGQLPRPHLDALALLARLEVLAEDAAKVAPGEEDGARPLPAAEDVLLAEVGEVGGDPRVAGGLADGEPAVEAVDLAVARAERADAECLQCLVDLLAQAARLPGLEIGGDELAGGGQIPAATVDLPGNRPKRSRLHEPSLPRGRRIASACAALARVNHDCAVERDSK